MALNNNIINSFTKVINDNFQNTKSSDSDTLLYATYTTVDGEDFVIIQGSNVRTPVVSSVSANNGDTVMIKIQNHEALVVGNVSDKSASSEKVETVEEVANAAIDYAQEASSAAEAATQSATQAAQSASQALSDASTANSAAQAAQNSANQALSNASTANTAAQQAIGDAQTAAQSATAAGISASRAQTALEAIGDYDWSKDNPGSSYFYKDATGAHIVSLNSEYRCDIDATGMTIVKVNGEVPVAHFGASSSWLGRNDNKTIELNDSGDAKFTGTVNATAGRIGTQTDYFKIDSDALVSVHEYFDTLECSTFDKESPYAIYSIGIFGTVELENVNIQLYVKEIHVDSSNKFRIILRDQYSNYEDFKSLVGLPDVIRSYYINLDDSNMIAGIFTELEYLDLNTTSQAQTGIKLGYDYISSIHLKDPELVEDSNRSTYIRSGVAQIMTDHRPNLGPWNFMNITGDEIRMQTYNNNTEEFDNVGRIANNRQNNSMDFIGNVSFGGTLFNDLFITQSVVKDGVSITSSSFSDGTITITKDGFTPIGIVGNTIVNASTGGSNGGNVVQSYAYINGNTLNFRLRNTAASTAANVKYTAYILYIKNI